MRIHILLAVLAIVGSYTSQSRADQSVSLSTTAPPTAQAAFGETLSLSNTQTTAGTCTGPGGFTATLAPSKQAPLTLSDAKLRSGGSVTCKVGGTLAGTITIAAPTVVSTAGAKKVEVSFGTTLSLVTESDTSLPVACTDQNSISLQSGTLTKVGAFLLHLTVDSLKAGGQVVCKSGAAILATIAVDATAPVPPPQQPAQPAPVAPPAKTECTDDQLGPPPAQKDALIAAAQCGTVTGGIARICVDEAATVLGSVPDLEGGQHVVVTLMTKSDQTSQFTLAVAYDRMLVKGTSELAAADIKSVGWVPATHWNIPLDASGTLTITVARKDHDEAPDNNPNIADPPNCHVSATSRNQVVSVSGVYHFSAGIMVSYTNIFDRNYGLSTGSDGVTRIATNETSSADIIANVVAFPWGVIDGKDKFAFGAVFGTSLRDPAKRWYLGPQLSTPLGFGFAAGVAISILPSLNSPLVAGQPLQGTSVPTGLTAVPTWWFGVNLEDGLFKKIFGAVLPKPATPTQ